MQMETAFSEHYIATPKIGLSHEQKQMNYTAIENVDTILRAINHDLRQQIINLLEEKKRMKVADIYQKLGLDQSAASLHLAILRHNKIVVTERNGRIIYYSLNHSRIAEVVAFINKLVSDHGNNKN